MNLTFPQREHLKNQREFSQVIKEGRPHKIARGKLHILETEKTSKLGFIVGKKVGHAPKRNRIRRLWKEAFRLERQHFQKPIRLVVQVFPGYEPPAIEQLRLTLQKLTKHVA